MKADIPRPVHLTRRAVSGLLVGGLLGVMLTIALLTRLGDLGSDSTRAHVRSSPDAVQQVMARHRCSTQGFGSQAIPASALIRTGGGHLLLVSFDRGWRLYEDRSSAAELVAVCLEHLPEHRVQKRP